MNTFEAEKSLLTSLEKVVRGVERLENEVKGAADFLEALLPLSVSRGVTVRIEQKLKRMRKEWPELFKGEG